MNIPLFSVILFVVGFLAGFILQKYWGNQSQSAEFADKVEEKLNKIIPQMTQTAGEQTALLAKEKLEAATFNLKDEFDNKQELIDKTIQTLNVELHKANEKLEKAERDRIGSFENLKQQITQQAKHTQDLLQSTTNLQRVLSNNQLRGQYGEQVAEDLLKMNGFVKGADYLIQDTQAEGARPDFTVLLPNNMKINIDSKFPYQNLLKIVESTTDESRAQYRKLFEQDIKEKIKQVTSRKYINPEENTVDFVVLFVPNEMIFSYIYDKMHEIWIDGMRQKVVFAGPFSFTAILRMVRQAHEYFSVQKNLRSIINNIQVFKDEFTKYHEEVDNLGKKVDAVVSQYRVVSQTRTNKLLRVVDKIQLDSATDAPALLAPEV
jgi:DNA recombination protein RmuC